MQPSEKCDLIETLCCRVLFNVFRNWDTILSFDHNAAWKFQIVCPECLLKPLFSYSMCFFVFFYNVIIYIYICVYKCINTKMLCVYHCIQKWEKSLTCYTTSCWWWQHGWAWDSSHMQCPSRWHHMSLHQAEITTKRPQDKKNTNKPYIIQYLACETKEIHFWIHVIRYDVSYPQETCTWM